MSVGHDMVQQQYAGFWLRAFAALIDCLITMVLGAIAGFIIGFIIGFAFAIAGMRGDSITEIAGYAGQLIGLIIGWTYFAVMESSSMQATLGKRILGLRVTTLEGRRISFARATGRYFAKIFSTLTLFVGYMMAGWTQKRQGLHDMIANTLVIKTSSPR